jgi:hypothetical protein
MDMDVRHLGAILVCERQKRDDLRTGRPQLECECGDGD